MLVSNTRGGSSMETSRGALSRAVSASLAVLAIVGMSIVAPVAGTPASAATAASSDLTIKWTGDNSPASQFQPTRNDKSPHFREFTKLSISVSQTVGLIDQGIRVKVAGFAGTRSGYVDGSLPVNNVMNFMQAMQCWGDPADANFRQTCQWGARDFQTSNGLGNSVYPDLASRTSRLDADQANPTTHDVPFVSVDGGKFSGKPVYRAGQSPTMPIQAVVSPSTTNEIQSARIGQDGTGFFDFETQSSYQAPQLGCGTAAHLRCWLVVVPRGTVFGGDGRKCSDITNPTTFDYYAKGTTNAFQGGSPINDGCDYWDNRIVVPLDFAPTGNTCPVGSAEVRLMGSQLMIGAMRSWQPSLCNTIKSTFAFSTNPDSIARAQLLQNGSPNLAFTGFPVSGGELANDYERDSLAASSIAYAPVATSGVVIAFNAEFDSGRQSQMAISPRLMAKILTQSYPFLVPQSSSNPKIQTGHLAPKNVTYTSLSLDPDFQALNPTNFREFTLPPSVIVPGPSGADAIRQVWRWIFADKDAVAFLNGAPDPWNMKVNPYYLPFGHTDAGGNPDTVINWYLDAPNANGTYIETPTPRAVGLTKLDGTPKVLTDSVLDTFPKNDETVAPFKLAEEKSRFDSIQQAPYVENLLAAARQTFRADPNAKIKWDPNKVNAAGGAGDWVTEGPQVPGSRFVIAVTDAPSAVRYGLSAASVQVPNSPGSLRTADTEGLANALVALQPTSLDGVKQVDPAKVPENGYPLTIVTYAAVNMSKASASARTTIAAMLRQVTTTGQVSGSSTGDLPAGYLPLTAEQSAQATAATKAIDAFVPSAKPTTGKPTTTTPAKPTTNGIAQDGFEESAVTDGSAVDALAADPKLQNGVAGGPSTARTEDLASTQGPGSSGLAIALVLGLLGSLIAPILFRGRGFS